jgi:putative ABC transport system permease protein
MTIAAFREAPVQDLRLAIRALRSTPIVSLVAVLSLALGIGVNTAIFSLVNSLLLRTLPVVEPKRLAVVSDTRAIRGGFTAGWTYAIWDQIRQRAQPFGGSCAWSTERFNLAQGGGETQPVDGIYASGEYFATLGVAAMLGRTFTPADDVPGGGKDGPVAVISYALWQRRFSGSGTIVGSSLVVERVPFTIVGVMPPAHGDRHPDGARRRAGQRGTSRARTRLDPRRRRRAGRRGRQHLGVDVRRHLALRARAA